MPSSSNLTNRACQKNNPASDMRSPPTVMGEGTLKKPIPKCRLYWCFCLGWWSNFVDSESGQKQNVKLLQNMAYNTTQHPPPPQPHTDCTFNLGRRGGVGKVREKLEGQQFTRGVENTNMTDCISSL
jgi:hypothetical protein